MTPIPSSPGDAFRLTRQDPATPPAQTAHAPVRQTDSAPLMRTGQTADPDFFAGLPREVRKLIQSHLISRDDRVALALVSRNHYADDQAERCRDFVLTHCHQISQLPADHIAGFSTSPRSLPLLQALPGASMLVDLYKLHCLHEDSPECETDLHARLGQSTASSLQAAFRLFRQWTQESALAGSNAVPFIDADFLGSEPLLARVRELSDQANGIETVIALTDALLTWTEHYGSEHVLMDIDGSPLPATWSALGELTQRLVRHCADHPRDPAVTPQLLLRLTSWCHFVQESGLLQPGATYSSGVASELFPYFAVHDCVIALLKKLEGNAAQTEASPLQLANQQLARQVTAHKTQPADCPHMASLRVFSVLMHAGDTAIAAATPEGLALLDIAITATHNEFARFAATVDADRALGFYAWEGGEPPQLASEFAGAEQFARDAVIGWTVTSDLIDFHGEQTALNDPVTELMDKLYGDAHDIVRGMQDPLRGTLHALTDDMTCQLRMIDSMIVTLRELSLRVAAMPEPVRPALIEKLHAIVQLWPIEAQRERLEAWIPRPQ